jgi:hypothetical protein
MSGRRAREIRKLLASRWPEMIKHYGRRLRSFKNINRQYKALYMRGELA